MYGTGTRVNKNVLCPGNIPIIAQRKIRCTGCFNGHQGEVCSTKNCGNYNSLLNY